MNHKTTWTLYVPFDVQDFFKSTAYNSSFNFFSLCSIIFGMDKKAKDGRKITRILHSISSTPHGDDIYAIVSPIHMRPAEEAIWQKKEDFTEKELKANYV